MLRVLAHTDWEADKNLFLKYTDQQSMQNLTMEAS